jgi:2-oxoglutarate ferredoxin oxidoreductase subunit beta
MAKVEVSELDVVYCKPRSLEEIPTHYCAGCGHGMVHRMIAEVVDELDIRERAICVASIGCSVTS